MKMLAFTWKTSKLNFDDISAMHVRAKGVKFCWTTKIARKTFSDFIRLVYVFIVFTPTFGSSG